MNDKAMESGPEDSGYVSNGIKMRYPLWTTLGILLIGGFMAMLDSSIVNVAIPSMMSVFGVGSDSIGWILTIYMLVLGVVVPMSGWLGDFLGYKRFYLISLAIFTVGSALCALAWNVPSLTAARAVQALGGGMIMPTTMSMFYRLTPRHMIGKAMGLFGMTFVVAPAIGPTVGGYLVEFVNWRWIFTINIPIGIAGILLGALVIPEIKGAHPGRFDWWGAATSAIGLFCALFALSEGSDWGWTSMRTILLLYFSVTFLGLFVYHQLTTPEPLLDLRVFRNVNYTMGNLLLIIVTIGMYGALYYIPIFLQSIKGVGALQSGELMMPSALVSAVMMPLSGILYDKVGPRVPVIVGIAITAVCTLAYSVIDIGTSLGFIILLNCLRSIGLGLIMMPTQTALMAEIATETVGRASAINNVLSRVAASLGIAALTVIMTSRGAMHSAHLAWNLSSENPLVTAGIQDLTNAFSASGGGSSSALYSVIGTKIYQMSFIQSMNDVFIITGLVTLLAAIPALLMSKAQHQKHTSGLSKTEESILIEEGGLLG